VGHDPPPKKKIPIGKLQKYPQLNLFFPNGLPSIPSLFPLPLLRVRHNSPSLKTRPIYRLQTHNLQPISLPILTDFWPRDRRRRPLTPALSSLSDSENIKQKKPFFFFTLCFSNPNGKVISWLLLIFTLKM
jgi:hypothetical protein